MGQMNTRRPTTSPKSNKVPFTPQQTLMLILVTGLGLAALGLLVLFLFSGGPSPAAPIAQAGAPTRVQSAPNTPTANPLSTLAASSNIPLPVPCAQQNQGVSQAVEARVIDGQTLEVNVAGQVLRVGYAGIQSPPSGALVQQAAQTAQDVIANQTVLLVKDVSEQDFSGRLLRYVFAGGRFVNYELVQQGLAHAAPDAPDLACAALLAQAEQQARAGHKGLWRQTPVPTATFMPFVTLAPSLQAGCDCASRPTCGNFQTHAAAQACFNACNDYSSKLDEDHDGIACEELP